MANFLSDALKQQVIALGRSGWTLRRIEAATGVRRETASAYLKAAGLAVRPPGAGVPRRQTRPRLGVELASPSPSRRDRRRLPVRRPLHPQPPGLGPPHLRPRIKKLTDRSDETDGPTAGTAAVDPFEIPDQSEVLRH